MVFSTSTSLHVTISHAIAYLTCPLASVYPATTIAKLQLILEANLTAFYAPSWVIKEPLRGSGRRCLTLAPDCHPPRPIYASCIATGINWSDWAAVLGGREFDFFVDPGCVSIRYGKKGVSPIITVWSDEVELDIVLEAHRADAARLKAQRQARSDVQFEACPKKTVAQQILEADTEEDDELFAMLADEIAASAWMTPLLDQFPVTARSTSPLSDISVSSLSSSTSSSVSFSSPESPAAILRTPPISSPPLSTATHPEPVQFKMSRRERARQARVFIDKSKTDVTPYDGGKTTVLTGGVMLGGASKTRVSPQKRVLTPNENWRSSRF
jgi:hypothetical protein